MKARRTKTATDKSASPSRLNGANPLDLLEREMRNGIEQEVFGRDPAFLEAQFPVLEQINQYFGGEVRGLERLPKKGPFLLVCNHSGGTLSPDSTVFMHAWFKERGFAEPFYFLGFDMLFALTPLRQFIRKAGVLPARNEHAEKAFGMGAPVLVYPGGEWEIFRPWTQRNTIDFHGRKGFIKLAISKRVPVVPVVAHGGHDTTFILSRGETLARRLGLDRFRMKTFPLRLGLPFGIAPAFLPALPLPAKITLEVLPPLDWSAHARRVRNPAVLQACYDEITAKMQAKLDELAAERPVPVLSRLDRLLRLAS